jgi:beta-lactam-binding protein with PASTA domain
VYVVNRGGVLMRDNGACKNTYQLAFYGGVGPSHVATCKPNEVVVPDVVGDRLSDARARLDAQPLNSTLIYRPARPGERLGVVVNQFPRVGTASAYDKITLVLPKSLHGAIPKVVGLPVDRAQDKLARLNLDVHVNGPSDGRVVRQSLDPGTAAAPGLRLTLSAKP